MGILDFFSGLLGGSVGNSMDNDPGDVRKAKNNLKNAGYMEDDAQEIESPFITRKMDEGIKAFQKDNGLKIDGIMKPGGETERGLFEILTGRSADEVLRRADPDAGSVGFGGNISGTLASGREQEKPLSLNERKSAVINTYDKPEPEKFFENKTAEFDATGRMIKDNTPPVPERKPVLTLQQRKEAILKDKSADFKIVSNPDADGSKPWYALDSYSEVKSNEKTIEREAKKAGVDPDMVKAIVHLETTQGWYDGAFALAGINKSIRPMNVHAEYWKDLGYSRKELEDPKKNIQAGVELLKRIKKRMPNASIDEIASVYNALDARHVSDYGARIKKLVEEKPWEKKNND